jgi:hypothetical protein
MIMEHCWNVNFIISYGSTYSDRTVLNTSSKAIRIIHILLLLMLDSCNCKAVPWLRRLAAVFPPRRPGFQPGSGHIGFVVDKVALGQVFSEYFGFPSQFSFHRLLYTHPHLSSGAGAVGQIVADAPSGLGLTPPQEVNVTVGKFNM